MVIPLWNGTYKLFWTFFTYVSTQSLTCVLSARDHHLHLMLTFDSHQCQYFAYHTLNKYLWNVKRYKNLTSNLQLICWDIHSSVLWLTVAMVPNFFNCWAYFCYARISSLASSTSKHAVGLYLLIHFGLTGLGISLMVSPGFSKWKREVNMRYYNHTSRYLACSDSVIICYALLLMRIIKISNMHNSVLLILSWVM